MRRSSVLCKERFWRLCDCNNLKTINKEEDILDVAPGGGEPRKYVLWFVFCFNVFIFVYAMCFDISNYSL
jgi:hypothetical protein